ncbi:hypothetical protein K2173_026891 [Erythroxylum novogranatense]|uniref:DUF4283 domain-containing protein n=1 Tax=Erythroxylum novogranatense TaxID=1862640 RepID=A0AAV8U0F0_9ROSI|nr:hypothetical protein K2173_026891 [Erythroxylum novogranatense]
MDITHLPNLCDDETMRLKYRDEHELLPCYSFKGDFRDELEKSLKGSVIVKILGKSVGFYFVSSKLNQLWKPKGKIEITDLENDFYMIKFAKDEDRHFALSKGPWIIQDHYLMVREWRPKFHPSTARFDTSLVFRIPELPMEYYNATMLTTLARSIGQQKKLDGNTFHANKGKFAVPMIEIEEVKYRVVYEALHKICICCGIYGHVSKTCSTRKVSDETGDSVVTKSPPVEASNQEDS